MTGDAEQFPFTNLWTLAGRHFSVSPSAYVTEDETSPTYSLPYRSTKLRTGQIMGSRVAKHDSNGTGDMGI